MKKKIAVNSKLITSIVLDDVVVSVLFSDTYYVDKKYNNSDDAEKAYNELVKEFGLYKFI